MEENIFGIDSSRPLRLDEFRQNLRSSCAEASLSLKEDWPASLQTIVLREFDSVQPPGGGLAYLAYPIGPIGLGG